MGYTVEWALEGRLIEVAIQGLFSVEELGALRTQIYEEFLPYATPPVVHTMYNIQDFENFTFGVQELLDYPQAKNLSAEQRELLDGWRIYYGRDDKTFQFITSIFHQSHGHRAHWLPSRGECLAFLMERDSTLEAYFE